AIFAVPDDPSRSGNAPIPVSGALRLLLEGLVFAGGVLALWGAGYPWWGITFVVIVALHYALSYDRILWLLSR
ncbi:MAG: YrdB family protein, partial [Caldilineaceae bacterium]|nr:YrdB family protein [Caldilineaceae bacterium]